MIISNDLIRDTLLCIAKHIEPLTSNDRYQMFYTPNNEKPPRYKHWGLGINDH